MTKTINSSAFFSYKNEGTVENRQYAVEKIQNTEEKSILSFINIH